MFFLTSLFSLQLPLTLLVAAPNGESFFKHFSLYAPHTPNHSPVVYKSPYCSLSVQFVLYNLSEVFSQASALQLKLAFCQCFVWKLPPDKIFLDLRVFDFPSGPGKFVFNSGCVCIHSCHIIYIVYVFMSCPLSQFTTLFDALITDFIAFIVNDREEILPISLL